MDQELWAPVLAHLQAKEEWEAQVEALVGQERLEDLVKQEWGWEAQVTVHQAEAWVLVEPWVGQEDQVKEAWVDQALVESKDQVGVPKCKAKIQADMVLKMLVGATVTP